MPDKIEIRHIELDVETVAELFKLPQQIIDYLWERIDIAKKNKVCVKDTLAGNISHSYKLDDPQNAVIPYLFHILHNPNSNPKMYEFINSEVQRVYKIVNLKERKLEPYLESMWVNFQKKCEFQPLHTHDGAFSFVIWMDIPYHYKDESKLPIAKSSNKDPYGGNFSFVTSDGTSREVKTNLFRLSPEMNGYCCFFPSDLAHQVYPFYTSDKDRISISGNIMYR